MNGLNSLGWKIHDHEIQAQHFEIWGVVTNVIHSGGPQ